MAKRVPSVQVILYVIYVCMYYLAHKFAFSKCISGCYRKTTSQYTIHIQINVRAEQLVLSTVSRLIQ